MTAIRMFTVSGHFTAARHPSNLRKIIRMDSASSTKNAGTHSGSFIYGLGFVGALVYFLQTATTFWLGVLGFFKAVFWPAFLIYYILEFLKR